MWFASESKTQIRGLIRPHLAGSPARRDTHDDALVWVFIAFGPRHPTAGVRSVYERAQRLHGRFPA